MRLGPGGLRAAATQLDLTRHAGQVPRPPSRQAAWREAHAAWVATWDLIGPFSGPCGLCGHPDRRHRIADALVSLTLAGEAPEDISADHEMPVESVIAVTSTGVAAELARRAARGRRGASPDDRRDDVKAAAATR